MRPVAAAWMIASLTLGLAPGRVDAQEHHAKPAATTAKQAATPATPAVTPAKAAPAPTTGSSHSPVIAPSKPVVAPAISPGGSGATPTAARPASARTLSVSARQAAEQTIAALVAAMKNMPKRPPAPPESRTPRARNGEAAARGLADGPTPITYHVTWPVTPPELGLDSRVELVWPGAATAAAPVALRWNDPTPD